MKKWITSLVLTVSAYVTGFDAALIVWVIMLLFFTCLMLEV